MESEARLPQRFMKLRVDDLVELAVVSIHDVIGRGVFSPYLFRLHRMETGRVHFIKRLHIGNLADNLREYGRILEVPQQTDFYRSKISSSDSRVYVIISDAMRYEVAVEWYHDRCKRHPFLLPELAGRHVSFR